MCFVFEESFQSRLDEALRKYRHTFGKPVRNGHEIFTPERQKSEEVRLVRHECVNIAANWFKENLPGVFSSGLLGDQLPTCELVTLHRTEPFPSQNSETPPPLYLRVLDLYFSYSTYRSIDELGLKFSLHMVRQDPEYHSVFAVRGDGLDGNQLLQMYGGSSGLVGYVDSTYQEMIGELAIEALLDGYNRSLNTLRDTITTGIRKSSRRRPFNTLQSLIDNVAYDVDIAAITTDLISSTDTSSGFRRSLPRFEPCDSWLHGQDSLADSLCLVLNGQAMRLQQADRAPTGSSDTIWLLVGRHRRYQNTEADSVPHCLCGCRRGRYIPWNRLRFRVCRLHTGALEPLAIVSR